MIRLVQQNERIFFPDPNPIAATTCKILTVDEVKGVITVADVDAQDGTSIVDLKAYFPVVDRVKRATIPEWLAE